MDNFDLFNKDLSFDEAMQYDSLIDNGTYDPHLILCASLMKNPEYIPSSEQAKNIMNHINNTQQTESVETKSETTGVETVETKPEPSAETPVKKNKRKQYIKLPDARIEKHSDKYESLETQTNNESSTRGKNKRNTGTTK